MQFLKLLSGFREIEAVEFMKPISDLGKMEAVAGREALGTKALTFYEQTAQVDKVQEAATGINSFFTGVNEERKATIVVSCFILLFSLFLFTFLGFMVARRYNRRPLNIDVQGEQPDEEQQMLVGNPAEANLDTDNRDQAPRRHCLATLGTKLNFGTRVALLNFILEIPSAVFDQIASDKKPAYVLIVMLISFASVLVCIVELVCNGRKQRITWKWSCGRIPWFYHPPPLNNKPFGTSMEMVGLVCAISQCTISTINYSFCLKDHAAPIKICVWPTIFSFGLLCSRFMANPKEDFGESRTSDRDEGDVALNEATLEPLTPAESQQ